MLLPDNADYSLRSAKAMMLGNGPAEEIRRRLSAAVGANPLAVAPLLARAGFELSWPDGDYRQAVRDMARVLELDPCNVAARISYADVLASLGMAAQAHEQYQESLKFDAALDKGNPKRMTAPQVEAVRRKMGQR